MKHKTQTVTEVILYAYTYTCII